jgi:hypothetical protein
LYDTVGGLDFVIPYVTAIRMILEVRVGETSAGVVEGVMGVPSQVGRSSGR